ncbi:hypothetical protein HYW18_01695 [Candidatus Uhrbacteria bacterium]|nr:hypothetical protein [Candidatus Uhrbacteria bacterium]
MGAKRSALFLAITLSVTAGLFFLSSIAFGAEAGLGANLSDIGAQGLPTQDVRVIAAKIVRAVIGFLGIVFVCLIVYAGIRYMLAGGDPKKIQTARGIIRTAVIGLAIVLASYGIASFILSALLRSLGLRQPSTSTNIAGFIEPLSGALGQGIIEDHYPARGAVEIPRNTKIIVTFKESMFVDSLIAPGTIDPVAEVPRGKVNAGNVKIYRTADGVAGALVQDAVDVTYTADKKIFVFDPVEFIGSAEEEQNYSVLLDADILKLGPDLTTTFPAFPPPNTTGYAWSFTVSTVVDITPPYVQSVIPVADRTVDRNIVVQVNFNEAVDPTATAGVHRPTATPARFFSNLQVRDDDSDAVPVEGTWRITNGYRTTEFTSFDQCGENACGGAIFCLPGNDDFTLLVRAATLGAEPPQALFTAVGYDGVVDVAGNSLDGGGKNGDDQNLIANGPPANAALTPEPDDDLAIDNFWSFFSTTDDVNLDRPAIASLLPTLNQPDVDISAPVRVTFDVPMRVGSLTNTNMGIAPRPFHEIWYRPLAEGVTVPAVPPATEPEVVGTVAVLEHGSFLDYLEDTITQLYYPFINNEVESAYQICYYPAYGPPGDCAVDASQPSCCDGNALASGSCPLPPIFSPPAP